MIFKIIAVLVVLISYGFVISKRVYALNLIHPSITAIAYILIVDEFLFELLICEIMFFILMEIIYAGIRKIKKNKKIVDEIDRIGDGFY